MRKTFLTGLAVLLGGVAVLVLGSALDLEVASTALLGVAVGAVVALVPDRSAAARLAGFVSGVAAAWIGYVVRAALLPDTTGGHAVSLALVIALCLALVLAVRHRVSLWTTLTGAACLAGGYETVYAAAPAEVLDTSVTAVTTVLLTVAVGFLAASAGTSPSPAPGAPGEPASTPEEHDSLDSMMEVAR